MTECSVSVVVAAHNPAHLQDTLRSISEQNVAGLDIVVVDDGSEPPLDASYDLATPVRTIRHETARERAAARTTGLHAARGEWVMVVDHDDLLARDALAHLLDVAQATGCDAVFGRTSRVPARAHAPFVAPPMSRLRTRSLPWWHVFCSSDHFGMVLARTATAREIGFRADFVPADDYLYAIELCATAHAVRVERVVGAWREHSEQTTRTSEMEVQDAVVRVRQHVLATYAPAGTVGRRVRSYDALCSDGYEAWNSGARSVFRRAVVRAAIDWPPMLVTKVGRRAVAAAVKSLVP